MRKNPLKIKELISRNRYFGKIIVRVSKKSIFLALNKTNFTISKNEPKTVFSGSRHIFNAYMFSKILKKQLYFMCLCFLIVNY